MVQQQIDLGPFYWHGLTLISAWVSNHMPGKVCDELTYPFLNFNGCTVEVWEWIINLIPHFIMNVITYSCPPGVCHSGSSLVQVIAPVSLVCQTMYLTQLWFVDDKTKQKNFQPHILQIMIISLKHMGQWSIWYDLKTCHNVPETILGPATHCLYSTGSHYLNLC